MKISLIELYDKMLEIFVSNTDRRKIDKCFGEFKKIYPNITIVENGNVIRFV